MPEDELEETVHTDETGRRYYTYTKKDLPDPAKRSRFCAEVDELRFYEADPITEEERQEADRLWEKIAMPGTSPGKKKKKE